MIRIRMSSAVSALALLSVVSVPLFAECEGLPAISPPTLETCKKTFLAQLGGALGLGCEGRNQLKTRSYDRMTKGFASGLNYNSADYFGGALDAEPRAVTVDSLRGCRGENINLEFTPGNVSYFEYELLAPSGVKVSSNAYTTWSGDVILGNNLTLTETGYFILRTRTTAPAQTQTQKNRDGSVRYVTSYPRKFRVAFRTDADVAALTSGAKVEATVNSQQPFIRNIVVKGGTKVRFRFASQGTGDFLVKILRQSGEELYRNGTPTSFYESPAFTPKEDEQFRVDVRPWYNQQAVGLQFAVIDDKATGQPIAIGARTNSAFKLPANFDGKVAPSVSVSETARFLLTTDKAESFTITVRPSQLAGLQVRLRVFNVETEELAVAATVIDKPTTIPVRLTDTGKWMVEVTPMSAKDLIESGEAKYGLELSPAPVAAPAPAASTARPAAPAKAKAKPPR